MNMPSDGAPEQAAHPGQPGQPEQPEQPDGTGRGGQKATPAPSEPVPSATVPPTPSTPTLPAPILPTQSREDTDVGWGDYAERDDNDRLLRDRPPHWDSA
ncbi:MAG: hypothetical protein ABSA02_32745 [Trebonia sp.]